MHICDGAEHHFHLGPKVLGLYRNHGKLHKLELCLLGPWNIKNMRKWSSSEYNH